MRIDAGGPAAGTVARAAYRGDRWLLTLESGDEEILAYSEVRREPGEEVAVRIDPAPMVVSVDEEDG